MKKLIEFYNAYQKQNKEQEQKKKIQNAINGLRKITFLDKSTSEAIEIKKQFDILFDQEIAKRGIDAQIEAIDCEEYFNKQAKTLQYGNK